MWDPVINSGNTQIHQRLQIECKKDEMKTHSIYCSPRTSNASPSASRKSPDLTNSIHAYSTPSAASGSHMSSSTCRSRAGANHDCVACSDTICGGAQSG